MCFLEPRLSKADRRNREKGLRPTTRYQLAVTVPHSNPQLLAEPCAALDDQMDLGLADGFLADDLEDMLGFADDLMLEEPA